MNSIGRWMAWWQTGPGCRSKWMPVGIGHPAKDYTNRVCKLERLRVKVKSSLPLLPVLMTLAFLVSLPGYKEVDPRQGHPFACLQRDTEAPLLVPWWWMAGHLSSLKPLFLKDHGLLEVTTFREEHETDRRGIMWNKVKGKLRSHISWVLKAAGIKLSRADGCQQMHWEPKQVHWIPGVHY